MKGFKTRKTIKPCVGRTHMSGWGLGSSLERQCGARKDEPYSFSLRRWAWQRNRGGWREKLGTKPPWEDSTVAFIKLARHVNGGRVGELMRVKFGWWSERNWAIDGKFKKERRS